MHTVRGGRDGCELDDERKPRKASQNPRLADSVHLGQQGEQGRIHSCLCTCCLVNVPAYFHSTVNRRLSTYSEAVLVLDKTRDVDIIRCGTCLLKCLIFWGTQRWEELTLVSWVRVHNGHGLGVQDCGLTDSDLGLGKSSLGSR